jgi:hypothetical protein
MIRYIQHKEIDKKKWDACIDGSPEGNIFVRSFYLDAVCDAWCGLVLNDYEAVFPLAPGSKYRIAYLFQPFFSRYFGTYAGKAAGAGLQRDFFNAIPDEYRYIEFCLPEGQEAPADFEQTERKYQLLSLGEAYKKLYEGYSENAKRSIKKAVKAGAGVEWGINPAAVVELFRNTKGKELEVFDAGDYRNLLRLMKASADEEHAESIAVYDAEKRLCAAAFFMRYRNRYVFLKSGVTEYGKNHGCMHLLFDAFIKKNAGGEMFLDFGGSSVESVARFYKNFGAKDCVYLQVKKNSLPRLVNWIKSLKK